MMPWHVEKGGGTCGVSQWAVIKDSDGSTAGCHPSKADASKQMAALYAKEPTMGANSAAPRENLIRSVPFEAEHSDGLTLEGYAAVFNSPTRINSWEGEFDEVIAPGAFKRTLKERTPVLMFEHGQHPLIGTMPLGTIQEAREDDRGLYVRARLSDNWLIQPVRDAVRDGGVNGMSFRFSVPEGGDKWQQRKGDVDLRTLHEVSAPELGPVVFPAYEPTTATIRSLAEQLPDFTGRPDARSAGGGDPDAEPGNGDASPVITPRQRAETDTLRLLGIIR